MLRIYAGPVPKQVLVCIGVLIVFFFFGGMMPLFLFIFEILQYIHCSFILSHSYITRYIRSSLFAEAPLHPLIAAGQSVGKISLWCREPENPRIELGPALLQADALPTKLRRSLVLIVILPEVPVHCVQDCSLAVTYPAAINLPVSADPPEAINSLNSIYLRKQGSY